MRVPNPAVRLPQWAWLEGFDRWRCERGILTGRWTQAEVDENKRWANEMANELQKHFE